MICMQNVQNDYRFQHPLSDMRSDQYSWSRNRYPANFASNWPFCHRHSMNIGRIANLNAGGDSAHHSAQSTYWPCHSTIRIHILHWRQSCRNNKFGPAVRFKPGQIPTVLCPGWITTGQEKCWSDLWLSLEPNQTRPNGLSKSGPHAGCPDPVLTLCEMAVMQHNADSVSPSEGVFVWIICWWGYRQKAVNEKKWEVLRNK
jgi:hypothetical protein